MANPTDLQAATDGISFSDIESIVADIRDGKMVIMVDDENRENEGDLLMAAEKVRPEDINYMARYGRGLICLTITRDRCAQLRSAPHGRRYRSTACHKLSRCRSRRPRVLRRESQLTIGHGPYRLQWLKTRSRNT